MRSATQNRLPLLVDAFARRVAPIESGQPGEPDVVRAAMLLVALVGQAVTIWATWDVWSVRSLPPNLPIVPLPAIPFGPAVLLSLLPILVRPRAGVMLHGLVMLAALAFDQYRLQPQFFGMWLLLWACVSQRGEWFARWFLAVMWFWAGLHKLLSPEWLEATSWKLLVHANFDTSWHWHFAIGIAIFELAAGVCAVLNRRIAAMICVLMHVGIVGFLLQWGHNESVWAWNLATAIVGCWLFTRGTAAVPSRWPQWAVVAALLVSPVGVYAGWLNPHLSHVLYSDMMPRGWITSQTHFRSLHTWAGLKVPTPDSHWIFVRTLEASSEPSDKLFIQDPRPWVDNAYYVLGDDGRAVGIDRAAFLASDDVSGATYGLRGIEGGDPHAVTWFTRRGAKLERDSTGLVVTLSWRSSTLTTRDVELLAGLPNLQTLRLEKANIPFALDTLHRLPHLEIVELPDSSLSPATLHFGGSTPALRWLDLSGTNVSQKQLRAVTQWKQLEVLYLTRTQANDETADLLGELTSLRWLDLAETAITSDGLEPLSNLKACEFLDLKGTQVDDTGLVHLHGLPRLEYLQLQGTSVSRDGVSEIRNALPDCLVRYEMLPGDSSGSAINTP